MPDTILTQSRLKELLSYDPNTGVFIWKEKISNNDKGKVGDIAGCMSRGYVRIKIENSKYMAHRLAWLYLYGKWPEKYIDHINKDKTDNRVVNLRDVSHRENMKNQKKRSDNTSGCVGVHLEQDGKKWQSRITHKGKRIVLGRYARLGDAIIARKEAEIKYEFHVNHGA